MSDSPWPLVEMVVEPRSRGDQEKLGLALENLAGEDPTFSVSTNPQSGQTILHGMGELHLDIKVDILKRTYKVDASFGAPQVAYRETLGRRAEIDRTHKKHLGPMYQFARVKIVFEPGEPGSGYVFESKTVGGSVLEEYIPGVQKGLASAKESGLLFGYPVIDFKATLVDGAYHDVDSSVIAFEVAARAAFGELRVLGDPRLLEPVVSLKIVAQDSQWRSIVGWLDGRQIETDVDEAGSHHVVTALAPLAKTLGLWRMLVGCGLRFDDFSVEFAHYAPVAAPDDHGPDLFPNAAALRA